MDFNDFLSRLKKVEGSGDKYIACCPAHDDSNPSMSVTLNGNKILVHCHAGCTAEEITGAMGLTVKDLFVDSRPADDLAEKPQEVGHQSEVWEKKKDSAHKDQDYGELVCEYPYQDESGVTLFKQQRRLRKDGRKTFITLRADGQSRTGWTWGLKDANIPHLIYRLPEVVAAAKAGKQIVICEGEKDVESLRSLGFVATCNLGGAGKWGVEFPEDWIRWFKGSKGVLIIADNDAKTISKKKRGKAVSEEFLVGQKHAWSVRTSLLEQGFEGKIKLMVMPDVGGEKQKDFTDWLEATKELGVKVTAETVAECVRTAAEWPKEWEFNQEGISLEQVAKAARTLVNAGDGWGVLCDGYSPLGRFGGRASVRTRGKNHEIYRVDFEYVPGKHVWVDFEFGLSIKRMENILIGKVVALTDDKELPRGCLPKIKAWCGGIWLLMNGKFFWHLEDRTFNQCMFLNLTQNNTKLMKIESDEFYAFVAHAAELDDVDPGRGDLGKIMGIARQIAISDDYSQGIIPSAYWDRRGDAIYISSGDTKLYKLSKGKVEELQNGADGVVFLRGKTLSPWKFDKSSAVDPFVNAKIFKSAAWQDKVAGPYIIRAWVMTIFACQSTKPPLLITGEAGSGKTRMAKAVKEMLGMRNGSRMDASVQVMEDGDKGCDAFWATVNEGRLEVFDNLDTRIKWASDSVQAAATDGQVKRRKLYSSGEVVLLRANSYIIFTSNSPVISTEGNGGVADRLITVRLLRNREESDDKVFTVDFESNRDKYLSYIAQVLSKAISDTSEVADSINSRHPDFGEFAIRVGRACGMEEEIKKALGSVEVDKLLLPLQNDAIMREILVEFKLKEYNWPKFTSKMLSDLIIQRVDPDDSDAKVKQIYGSRNIGRSLGRYARQLRTLFVFPESKTVHGIVEYSLGGCKNGVNLGGMVEEKSHFGKSLDASACGGLCENSLLIPPNPPIRARAVNSSSHVEEKKEEESIEDIPFELEL